MRARGEAACHVCAKPRETAADARRANLVDRGLGVRGVCAPARGAARVWGRRVVLDGGGRCAGRASREWRVARVAPGGDGTERLF
eukprot:6806922-Prymnesium_polylepis.1